jgi:hypothetical protein
MKLVNLVKVVQLSIVVFALNICSSVFASTTLVVPDDYLTIQQAINAASDGDFVEVRTSDLPPLYGPVPMLVSGVKSCLKGMEQG